MENEFLPYELAVEMKSIGFDEPCSGYCVNVEVPNPFLVTTKISDTQGGYFTFAPLYQQAFRWFREKYQLHSTITSISQESWQWHITKPGESLGKLYDEDFYTYEEAELECLKKLIEIIKNP